MTPLPPNAAKPPAFRNTQYQFAAHIRNPDAHPAPSDIEDRRMAVYRELFYNNVEGFMANSFPVLRAILDDAAWHNMVRDYFARHQAKTPLFHEMAQEFVAYLQDERDCTSDPDFLVELAHYEWVELALSVAEDPEIPRELDANGDLLKAHPFISPLAWPLSYYYEVHRISPEYIPERPATQPLHLIVYRDRNDEVGFMEMNPVAARLLQLLRTSTTMTGDAALRQITAELQHPNPAVVVRGGLQALEQLRERDIILGTTYPNDCA